jgi:hypothetical protein
MKIHFKRSFIVLFLVAGAARADEAQLARSEPDVDRPLKWLLAAQNDEGGWGAEIKSPPDVATTAISGLALLRLGHPSGAGAVRRAVGFVVHAVEKTPEREIAVNPPGTLPQRKLGRYIDTFLAAQFLAAALPSVPQGERGRVRAALDGCVNRIARAQQADGSYASDGGWAPVLSSAFANEGLYAARGAGAPVPAETLKRGDGYMLRNYDDKTRQFRTSDSAGVELYTMAGTVQAAARAGQMNGAGAQAALARLSDENFIRGFGSYGGEEHVSYLLTSEALAQAGGKNWERWDHGIRLRLAHIQRPDGTWRGDHCITSTAFCTAASLLTLTVRARPSQQPHA